MTWSGSFADGFPYNCLLWPVRTLCSLHGGLLCVFSTIFGGYCFNPEGVMRSQTEMYRMHWALLTPTRLLLPSPCLPVCLSLYCSPLLFLSLSLLRLTPLSSILPHSLHFLPSFPLTSLPSFLSFSSSLLLSITPTSLHHSLISSHPSQSVLGLLLHPPLFS